MVGYVRRCDTAQVAIARAEFSRGPALTPRASIWKRGNHLQKIVAKLRRGLNRLLLTTAVRPLLLADWTYVGITYAGWWVPFALLPSKPLCVAAGAGTDISFDVGMAARGAKVLILDPTPMAIAHVNGVLNTARSAAAQSSFDPENIIFVPTGLYDRAAEMKFYLPKNREDTSLSIENLEQTDEYILAQCDTLESVAANNGFQAIDLLKLDIEGVEHLVIADMLAGPLRPSVVLCEFDQPCALATMMGTVRAMKRAGYRFARIHRWNLTFTRGG